MSTKTARTPIATDAVYVPTPLDALLAKPSAGASLDLWPEAKAPALPPGLPSRFDGVRVVSREEWAEVYDGRAREDNRANRGLKDGDVPMLTPGGDELVWRGRWVLCGICFRKACWWSHKLEE